MNIDELNKELEDLDIKREALLLKIMDAEFKDEQYVIIKHRNSFDVIKYENYTVDFKRESIKLNILEILSIYPNLQNIQIDYDTEILIFIEEDYTIITEEQFNTLTDSLSLRSIKYYSNKIRESENNLKKLMTEYVKYIDDLCIS